MGQAKLKRRIAFPQHLVEEWEAEDCVNFAVALARLTGWLLHVDWWSPGIDPDQEFPPERLKPLRVYVADHHDRIFDVRGIRTIAEFNERTIMGLARRHGTGGVRTRYYSEVALSSLRLHTLPDEAKISRAAEAIRANEPFFGAIPNRASGGLPAHEAARFTYGLCVPFAQALHELTDCKPVALLALRFSPFFEGTRRGDRGYFHSVVLHPDGLAEDSWGKASIEEIARRFGVLEFKTSSEEQRLVAETLQRNSPERFDAALRDARALLRAHRTQAPGSNASPSPHGEVR